MEYYIIKIDNREYQVKREMFGLDILTPDGWIHEQDFIDYLYKTEKTNAILDLAQVGLNRLLGHS